jgi:DNA-directed RNA polymerase subunit RPC12/RpoP
MSIRICKSCDHEWEQIDPSDDHLMCPNCGKRQPILRHCLRCGNEWEQRRRTGKPKQCTFCHSPKWNIPLPQIAEEESEPDPELAQAGAFS